MRFVPIYQTTERYIPEDSFTVNVVGALHITKCMEGLGNLIRWSKNNPPFTEQTVITELTKAHRCILSNLVYTRTSYVTIHHRERCSGAHRVPTKPYNNVDI
jgi:hypothetical protein